MSLKRIARKIGRNLRLDEDDALFLFRSDDIHGIGELAAERTRRLHGDDVFFIRNRHVNPTNLCVNRCRFCAFSRSRGDEGAFEHSIGEILADLEDTGPDVREFHIVGGLHPDWGLDHYRRLLRSLKERFPGVQLKGFTAVEIDFLAGRSGLTHREVIRRLVEDGLVSMPGGGAEILGARVRRRICPEKITGRRWLAVMRAAHEAGLKTNATMLYGHVERPEDRVDHLRRLRALQDRTGGFNAFIPLAFQPENSPLASGRVGTSALDDLKTIAVSRLYLDNFPHVKAYWVMLGGKITQVALQFGANDIDGTVVRENIARMAGGGAGQAMGVEEMIRLIRAAGREPVERDSLYRPLRRYGRA